jgi:hypothetical protein
MASQRIPAPIGEMFGKLKVIMEAPDIVSPMYSNIRAVFVECECGTIKTVRIGALKNGNTKSCGCSMLAYGKAYQDRMHKLAMIEAKQKEPNYLIKRIKRIEAKLCSGELKPNKQVMFTIKLFKLTDKLLSLN